MTGPELAGLRHLASGKVRDLYEVDAERLLLVASDRISAYDVVLDPEVPGKGEVLTALTVFWLDRLADLVETHLLGWRAGELPVSARPLAGRALLVRRLDMIPVECVARGYLAGSGWAEYQADRTVCGVPLPDGLVEGDQLPEPIFTPATKADLGDHDENVDYEAVVAAIGDDAAAELRTLTLTIYARAEEIARERGIILADTKFEFGARPDGTIVLADEVLTPDSSRFWPADDWQPGRAQTAYDKQFVRDWLLSAESGWDRSSGAAPPPLPDAVVEKTRATYIEAFERLTGQSFR
jgi:phosphoribosylaminoimidazole-succinocarboxamide synthase